MLDNFRKVGVVWNHSTNQIYQRMRAASSDDHGRKLVVQITNDSVLENTQEVELRLYWEIKDKKGFNDFELIDAEHGIYEIYFSRGMLENKGTHKAWLHATDATGSITSEAFGIEVFRGIDLEAVEGTDDFSALNSALVRVVEIEIQEDERKQAEVERKTAETARKTAETKRDSAENLREQGEEKRDTNYQNAESIRDSKYDEREGDRDSAYNESEGVRDASYASKERERDEKYSDAEEERYRLYNMAEEDRSNEYGQDISVLESKINELKSERGSNQYGSWVKRADGTMDCHMTLTLPASSSSDPWTKYGEIYYRTLEPRIVNFPQEFKNVPVLSFSSSQINLFFTSSFVTRENIEDLTVYRGLGSNTPLITIYIKASGDWVTRDGGGVIEGGGGGSISGSSYPSYWKTSVDNAVNKVLTHQSKTIDAFSFGFITDTHYESNARNSAGLMKEIIERTGMNTFIHGGDHANNGLNALKNRTQKQIRDVLYDFAPIQDKMMNTMGNHDDNSISQLWAQTMKHPELYSELFRYMGNNSEYGPTGKYHYRDDNFQKVRYIVLDSIDIPYIQQGTSMKYIGLNEFAYREEQLSWLGNEALNVPSNDWSVVIISHNVPYRTGITGSGPETRNADLARKIVQAFKNKSKYSGTSSSSVESDFKASVSVDFTNKGGDVIAWLSGHVHYDNIVQLPEGIPLITTLNDNALTWEDTAPRRKIGDTSEHAFDIVTVNKNERKIYLTRVGAGADRSVDY